MEQHTIELIGMVLVAVITALVGPAGLEYVKAKLSKQYQKTSLGMILKEIWLFLMKYPK
jgi:ABC-type enterochelin transport system permease subunit